MKGIVNRINLRRGVIAVEVEAGDITVIEILGADCNIDVGDVLSGNLDSIGTETLMNLSKNEQIDGFIQDVGCSRSVAMGLIK